ALAIGGSHVRARGDQPIDRLHVAVVDGREQRRHTVISATRSLVRAARTLWVRVLRGARNAAANRYCKCEEANGHSPYARPLSLPVLSPCTSFSMPYKSRRLSSRLPVVTDFRS